MLRQVWRDCIFLHWPVDPDALDRHVPRGLELETFDDRAWIGLITFRLPSMRAANLPPLPGFNAGAETHLRTYVRGPDGRRGIWMLGVDFLPWPGAVLGRLLFWLPYRWASIRIERAGRNVAYRVKRGWPGMVAATLDATVGDPILDNDLTELDRFLTSRWVLYAGVSPVRTAIMTDHPPWIFRQVTLGHVQETYTKMAGMDVSGLVPLVHFSDGVEALLSWPEPLL